MSCWTVSCSTVIDTIHLSEEHLKSKSIGRYEPKIINKEIIMLENNFKNLLIDNDYSSRQLMKISLNVARLSKRILKSAVGRNLQPPIQLSVKTNLIIGLLELTCILLGWYTIYSIKRGLCCGGRRGWWGWWWWWYGCWVRIVTDSYVSASIELFLRSVSQSTAVRVTAPDVS